LLKFLRLSIIAFVDVTPEETVQKSPFESVKDDESSSVKEKARVPDEVSL